jgi:hypothetical protein
MVIFRFLSWKHYPFIGTKYAKRAISSNILFYIHCKWSPNHKLPCFICEFPRVLPLSIRTTIRAETRAKSRSGRVRVRAQYKRTLKRTFKVLLYWARTQIRPRRSHWISWFEWCRLYYINGERECYWISVRAEHHGDCLQSEFYWKDRANEFH